MKVNSLYVSIKDRDRAINFYQNILFKREPSLETDRFVFFNIDGFLFGLFDPVVVGEKVQYGNNNVVTVSKCAIQPLQANQMLTTRLLSATKLK